MDKSTKTNFIMIKKEDVKATTTYSSPSIDKMQIGNGKPEYETLLSESRYQSTNAEKQKTYELGSSQGFFSKFISDINNPKMRLSQRSDVEKENISSSKARLLKKEKYPPTVVARYETKTEKKSQLKKISSVVQNKVNKLKLPDHYNESQMFMPTGERLFWLGEIRPSFFGPTSYQDFNEIRFRCLAEGRLFEDPEFPAADRSLYFKERWNKSLTWLRPWEMCENPQLFVDGYSRFDVEQGELGDCWLLAAVVNLTMHKKLFFQVVPNDQSFDKNYAGIFHFRFWQYGRWVDVVIDDRLPTYNRKLVYLHSADMNEFWSALLRVEKAYAKLHGSYEALKSGSTCEAMEDFTGGVTEMYEMTELPPNFYTILLKAYERNSLMGCSIELDNNVGQARTPAGLIRGHAYSVTRVKYVDIVTHRKAGKIPLLRLRNPWGKEAEWNGPWSDKSPEWQFISESEKKELGLTFDDDGEFWMSFKDFVTHFDRIDICNLNPDSFNADECPENCIKKWEMSIFEGEWIKNVTAGGCGKHHATFWNNPHYTVTLNDPDEDDEENKCTIIVSLMQKNRRAQRHQGLDCLFIGFAIYRLPDNGHTLKTLDFKSIDPKDTVGRTNAFINLREVSGRFKLEPGSYVIVPSTFTPNEEAEFLLRVFSEKSNNMNENIEESMGDVDVKVKEIASNVEPTDRIRHFFHCVVDPDGEVYWEGLKEILDCVLKQEMSMCHDSDGILEEGKWGGKSTHSPTPTRAQEKSCLKKLLCGYKLTSEKQPYTNQSQPLEMLVQGFSIDFCRSLIVMFDKDKSGGLDFEEFKSLWTTVRQWQAVFHEFDSSSSGAVPRQQLRDALHSAGYTVNAHVLNVLAHRYISRFGNIRFDDFIMCTARLKTFIESFEVMSSRIGDATLTLDEWLNHTVFF